MSNSEKKPKKLNRVRAMGAPHFVHEMDEVFYALDRLKTIDSLLFFIREQVGPSNDPDASPEQQALHCLFDKVEQQSSFLMWKLERIQRDFIRLLDNSSNGWMWFEKTMKDDPKRLKALNGIRDKMLVLDAKSEPEWNPGIPGLTLIRSDIESDYERGEI